MRALRLCRIVCTRHYVNTRNKVSPILQLFYWVCKQHGKLILKVQWDMMNGLASIYA